MVSFCYVVSDKVNKKLESGGSFLDTLAYKCSIMI